jgi:hypothetical protein
VCRSWIRAACGALSALSLVVLFGQSAPAARAVGGDVPDAPVQGTGIPVSAQEGGQSAGGYLAAIYEGDWLGGGPGEGENDLTATVDWGDGSSDTLTLSAAEFGYRVSAPAHRFAEEGTYPVTITVVDADGATSTILTTATVADAPLSASGQAIAVRGATVDQTHATFSDQNPGTSPADYSASIDWGDGARTAGVISAAAGRFQVAGEHTYSHPGSFKVTVTITDKGGSSATVSGPAVAPMAPGQPTPHGRATLRGVPSGCSRSPSLRLTVRGAEIARASFRLDGKRRHARTIHEGSLYRAMIKLPVGAHRLTVKIVYRQSSGTSSKTFRRRVSRCHG